MPRRPTYGPDRQTTGIIEMIAQGLVQLKVGEDWRRWVPLVQVEAIDGQVVPTARRLARPKVDGAVRVQLGVGNS